MSISPPILYLPLNGDNSNFYGPSLNAIEEPKNSSQYSSFAINKLCIKLNKNFLYCDDQLPIIDDFTLVTFVKISSTSYGYHPIFFIGSTLSGIGVSILKGSPYGLSRYGLDFYGGTSGVCITCGTGTAIINHLVPHELKNGWMPVFLRKRKGVISLYLNFIKVAECSPEYLMDVSGYTIGALRNIKGARSTVDIDETYLYNYALKDSDFSLFSQRVFHKLNLKLVNRLPALKYESFECLSHKPTFEEFITSSVETVNSNFEEVPGLSNNLTDQQIFNIQNAVSSYLVDTLVTSWETGSNLALELPYICNIELSAYLNLVSSNILCTNTNSHTLVNINQIESKIANSWISKKSVYEALTHQSSKLGGNFEFSNSEFVATPVVIPSEYIENPTWNKTSTQMVYDLPSNESMAKGVRSIFEEYIKSGKSFSKIKFSGYLYNNHTVTADVSFEITNKNWSVVTPLVGEYLNCSYAEIVPYPFIVPIMDSFKDSSYIGILNCIDYSTHKEKTNTVMESRTTNMQEFSYPIINETVSFHQVSPYYGSYFVSPKSVIPCFTRRKPKKLSVESTFTRRRFNSSPINQTFKSGLTHKTKVSTRFKKKPNISTPVVQRICRLQRNLVGSILKFNKSLTTRSSTKSKFVKRPSNSATVSTCWKRRIFKNKVLGTSIKRAKRILITCRPYRGRLNRG